MNTFFQFGTFSFSSFSIIFTIMFIVFLVIVLTFVIKMIREAMHNNASPVLTVDATLITKRIKVNHSTNNNNTSSTSTYYFVTFAVPSGDRIEFRVKGTQYGMLAENDIGKLTFQGTRFFNFTLN